MQSRTTDFPLQPAPTKLECGYSSGNEPSLTLRNQLGPCALWARQGVGQEPPSPGTLGLEAWG